jgi:hypothetical protein
MIELTIEGKWSSDKKNAEEDKALTENRKVFLYFGKVITTNEWDNWEKCDEDKLGKMAKRFPVTGKEENKTCTQKQRSEDRNDESKTPRASISLFLLYISEHDLVLFLCDNLTREPTIEEGVDIHTRWVYTYF